MIRKLTESNLARMLVVGSLFLPVLGCFRSNIKDKETSEYPDYVIAEPYMDDEGYLYSPDGEKMGTRFLWKANLSRSRDGKELFVSFRLPKNIKNAYVETRKGGRIYIFMKDGKENEETEKYKKAQSRGYKYYEIPVFGLGEQFNLIVEDNRGNVKSDDDDVEGISEYLYLGMSPHL